MTAVTTRADLMTASVGRRITEDLSAIMSACDIDSIWEAATDAMAAAGFDRVIYGTTRRPPEGGSAEARHMLILSTHARDYLDMFLREAMYTHAPMLRWARENSGACSWSWVNARLCHLTAAERRVLDFNRSMGVTAGYLVSFPRNADGTRGAMSLTAQRGLSQASVDAIWNSVGEDLELLCNLTHLKILTMPDTGTRCARIVTMREVPEQVEETDRNVGAKIIRLNFRHGAGF